MKKYTIKRGDSLESIARFLKISVFDLRNFHNNHCDLQDLISQKLPSHLREILYESPQNTDKKDSDLFKGKAFFTPVLNPEKSKLTYGVMISSFTGENEDNLKFKIHIEWKKRNVIRIYRDKLFINGEEPHLVIDRLAASISSVLYPLELIIAPEGKMTGLNNYPEIKNRWNEIHPQIEKAYLGEVSEKYISLNEKVFSNPDLIFQNLQRDWFLNAFFSGIYRSYSLSQPQSFQKRFPLIPSMAETEYTGFSKIEALEGDGLMKIIFEGKAVDNSPPQNFNINQNLYDSPNEEVKNISATGDYKALYFMKTDNYTLSSMHLECTLNQEKIKKASVTASLLNQKKSEREEGIIEIVKTEQKTEKKNSFLFD